MSDNNMIALAEIRNIYSLKKYGNLNSEQVSLIKYDELCLNLIKENQKYKEVIDKAMSKLGRYADELTSNGNAYAVCVDLLDILKEVE